MLKTIWATVRQGRIELLESAELPEGTRVLVTLLPDEDAEFWTKVSEVSLKTVWDDDEDQAATFLKQGETYQIVSPFNSHEAAQKLGQLNEHDNYWNANSWWDFN